MKKLNGGVTAAKGYMAAAAAAGIKYRGRTDMALVRRHLYYKCSKGGSGLLGQGNCSKRERGSCRCIKQWNSQCLYRQRGKREEFLYGV